ncbi:hypothetical protein E2C01_052305 [Portunus trituberculatus]|uniref:Uncharacterized protein n=1 Tax=Portunus trituberculatus TaxID=210409 RepID=A0A5B7GM45_PORTR|nr:hypothetical protein [Portunus trituberculatus]
MRLYISRLVIRNIHDLSRFVNKASSKNTKQKGIIGTVEDGKLIKKCKIFSLEEKLDIIAKVEAGEKLCEVVTFYSDNKSTVHM